MERPVRRWRILLPLALVAGISAAAVACGTEGSETGEVTTPKDAADGATASDDSSTQDAGSVVDDASPRHAGLGTYDAATGGRTVPTAIADDLQGLLPDGQCPASGGALAAVTVDGMSQDLAAWVVRDGGDFGGTGDNVIETTGQIPTSDGGLSFQVVIPYMGGTGTFAPSLFDAELAFGSPTMFCMGTSLGGGVRITLVTYCAADAGPLLCAPGNRYTARVCGDYELDCADSQSGQQFDVLATFDELVYLGPGVGG